MIKVENIETWGFEHAIRGIKSKGYRKTKYGYETSISNNGMSVNLGTYKTASEAKKAVFKYRVKNFVDSIYWYGLNPYDGVEYKEKYIVFPSGEIFNLYGKEIIGGIDRNGYRNVIINGKNESVHRIVAKIFLDNPFNLEQVNHLNGIKTDNRIENLEWCSRSDNLKHAYRIGLEKRVCGESHHSHKLDNDSVRYIRRNYIKGDREFGFSALARKFGVDRTTVSEAAYCETWRDVL